VRLNPTFCERKKERPGSLLAREPMAQEGGKGLEDKRGGLPGGGRDTGPRSATGESLEAGRQRGRKTRKKRKRVPFTTWRISGGKGRKDQQKKICEVSGKSSVVRTWFKLGLPHRNSREKCLV